MNFEQLNLIHPLLQAINDKGFTTPTPIQIQAIPAILNGKDIFGNAQTGTGKTAAFALPVIQLLAENKIQRQPYVIRTLVLAPTRELVIQIGEEFNFFSKKLDIKHLTIFGGVSQHPQTNTLKHGCDVLIATPGRLLDLMQQGFVRLDQVSCFILDEADRMLDMGFIHDIRKITSKLPTRRQTLLFSATVPDEIKKLSSSFQVNPLIIRISPQTSASELVRQSVYHVDKENKKHLLVHLLSNTKVYQALVFTRTRRGADRVVRELKRNGIKAEAIHGDKSQNARERVLSAFKNHGIRVLVATDIASRGIDVDKLTHVINFEIPEEAETYIHRIGRTGRAGHEGTAYSFCAASEKNYLNNIHKMIRRPIDVVHGHPFPAVNQN